MLSSSLKSLLLTFILTITTAASLPFRTPLNLNLILRPSFLPSIPHINRGGMQIYVKTLAGKTLSIETSKEETIESLKSKISEKEGIPSVNQRLIFGGEQLSDGKLVGDFDLGDDDTIHLVLRLRGGLNRIGRYFAGGVYSVLGYGGYEVTDDFVWENVGSGVSEQEKFVIKKFVGQGLAGFRKGEEGERLVGEMYFRIGDEPVLKKKSVVDSGGYIFNAIKPSSSSIARTSVPNIDVNSGKLIETRGRKKIEVNVIDGGGYSIFTRIKNMGIM